MFIIPIILGYTKIYLLIKIILMKYKYLLLLCRYCNTERNDTILYTTLI